MLKVGVIGGETHLSEITQLQGRIFDIVKVAVDEDRTAEAGTHWSCPVTANVDEILGDQSIQIVAISNEHDKHGKTVLEALRSGKDVIVDKPLAINPREQDEIERELNEHPERRLLMLLTLRGEPLWAGLRELVRDGHIGSPMFTHIRMAVRLKRAQRPAWFLDQRRSGGLFLDLLIHGLDYAEWVTGRRINKVVSHTGNLGYPEDENLRDHAAVFCIFDDGSTAVIEGQRSLPDTKGDDYRVTIAGTAGVADLVTSKGLTVTSGKAAEQPWTHLPPAVSIVEDWLSGGQLVPQHDALRANRLALAATVAAAGERYFNQSLGALQPVEVAF